VRDPNGTPIHIDDSVWSDYYSEYLLDVDAVSVVHWLKKWGDCNEDSYYLNEGDSDYVSFQKLRNMFWYKYLSELYPNWEEHGGIMKDLLVIDYQQRWILKNFSVAVYECKDKSQFHWLDETASTVLNIDIDKSGEVISTCQLEYLRDLAKKLDMTYEDLEEMFKSAVDKIENPSKKHYALQFVDKMNVMKDL
jgi:hypothetical protein